jgi:hypothetical protein
MINKGNNRKDSFLARVRRKARLLYLKILRQSDTPEKIALGAAIGVAAGILPTFGLGAILALGVSYIVRANKVAAVLGSFIMNPVTTPLFWTLNSTVGGLIFWEERSSIVATVQTQDIFGGIKWAFIVFLSGSVIVASSFAIVIYFVMRNLIIRHRKNKLKKMGRQVSNSADSKA